METNQEREFNYEDILLYNVKDNSIIVILDDEEQLKKFNVTGNASDAPIRILPYSKEEEAKIISSMKQISEYTGSSVGENVIEVRYTDGTVQIFDESNLSVITQNLVAQRENSKSKAIGAWYDISPEKKEKNKKEIKGKLVKGLVSLIAAAAIIGGLYHGGKFIKNKNDDKDNDTEDPRKTEEGINATSKFKKEGAELYQKINDNMKNSELLSLNHQEALGVRIDEDLCLNMVEMINGVYPTSMLYMNEANAKAEMAETRQAINLIIASDLFPLSSADNMIDLSNYITDEKARVFAHNSLVLARECINESIGEPMNGELLDETEWTEVNKFSRQYTNAVEELFHYELDTINDAAYLSLPAGQQFLIASTFQNGNNTVPQHGSVIRIDSLSRLDEVRVYYRWFLDDVTKDEYFPRADVNGNTVYVRTYYDENGNCCEEVFTEDVMFAMAGLSTVEEQRNLGIQANPNIHQFGIQNEVDNRVLDASQELDEQIITRGYKK